MTPRAALKSVEEYLQLFPHAAPAMVERVADALARGALVLWSGRRQQTCRCGAPAKRPGSRGPVPVLCARCAHQRTAK